MNKCDNCGFLRKSTVQPSFSGYGIDNAMAQVTTSVSAFFLERIRDLKDVDKAYSDVVEEYYEGLPKGKSFATISNPKWKQQEIPGRHPDQAGDVTAPSDMEKVNLSFSIDYPSFPNVFLHEWVYFM